MTARPERRLSPEEYLALERRAEFRSEYLDGETFAMAGSSRRHNLLTLSLAMNLAPKLDRRGCEIYTTDMRVHVPATGLYTYPDAVVVCGEPRFLDAELDNLLNPTLIVEVLSKSTEGYDRGRKFEHYRSIESLREYLLVAQDRIHVERYVRRDDGRWLLSETDRREDRIELEAVGCILAIEDVYRRVPDLDATP